MMISSRYWIFSFCSLIWSVCLIDAEPLKRFENCRMIPTDWADGDSFLIETTEGEQHTIRLYGVDCIEWHVTDDSDATRLRSQRRYFGISNAGGSSQTSIAIAKDFGAKAGAAVTHLLEKPFTVYTGFADARGDGRYKRIYCFITTSENRDLAGQLVEMGLARAYGVYRETPAGKSSREYRAHLSDVELQAAIGREGVWSETDWKRLPLERQEEREEADELDLARSSTKMAQGMLINPNTAARDELMRLPGVGEVIANRIIESRPFRKTEDLLDVDGIGSTTLERLKPFLKLP